MLTYEARDIPQLKIEVKMHLVASVEVETADDYYSITMLEIIGKPHTLIIPMVFLHALLNYDLGRFAILARGSSHTTWEVPGAKTVRLPNSFVGMLTEVFRRKSVAMWLDDFGSQGRSVVPLVAGSLLGLEFQRTAQPIPLARQPCTPDQLVSALEAMAYKRGEAWEMVRRASPDLKADYTLEEGLRIVLRHAVKGE